MDPRAEDDYDFGPYAYVADNPVINVDPDGEFLFTAIGAVVGGASAAIKGGNWKEILKGAAAGAVAGAVIDITVATGGTGGVLIAAGAISGMAGEATSQALHGQTNVGDILKAGAFGAGMMMAAEAAPAVFRTVKGLTSKSSVAVETPIVDPVAYDDAGQPIVKSRSTPQSNGVPNSSEIQATDASGKTTKYTTYDSNGQMVKEYRGTGKPHGNIPRPNVKEPKTNTNPKTGQTYRNGYRVRPARPDEIPQ